MNDTFYTTIENKLKARYGVIWVQAFDFRRAYKYFKALAFEGDYNLYKWSCVEGLMEMGLTMDTVLSVGDNVLEGRKILTEVLRRADELESEIFVLEGFHDFIHFTDIKVLVQKLALELPQASRPKHMVILSPKLFIPEELARLIDVVRLPDASEQDYEDILIEVAKAQRLRIDSGVLKRMATAAKGLGELEARLIFGLAAVETNFSEDAVEVVHREKALIEDRLAELHVED